MIGGVLVLGAAFSAVAALVAVLVLGQSVLVGVAIYLALPLVMTLLAIVAAKARGLVFRTEATPL
jgi:hypothetical protein